MSSYLMAFYTLQNKNENVQRFQEYKQQEYIHIFKLLHLKYQCIVFKGIQTKPSCGSVVNSKENRRVMYWFVEEYFFCKIYVKCTERALISLLILTFISPIFFPYSGISTIPNVHRPVNLKRFWKNVIFSTSIQDKCF